MHAHTYTHTHARTHNHLTEQIAAPVLPSCLLTLKFTWSLVSQGCARRGREKKKGGWRVPGGDKEGNQFHFNWSCRAEACVVHTLYTCMWAHTFIWAACTLSSPFIFSPAWQIFIFFYFAIHRISEHKTTRVKMEVNVWTASRTLNH